ncbi:hypothetical protein ebA5 [Aromatoleum aromaticum EbN1]|uniref:Uncharacterized protein n=1 Tax=Aromatoleum aromaticum (strain DSM 19018 / LMG 30748 / EbN1) TaxID=76114 RepID=Q5P986_AROAE|nr:hypothetical protein [Aromatoleum aromaticum]CAI06123.1 hypothetical protein ebA5 [Aromatoleum aromaticum EbN1]
MSVIAIHAAIVGVTVVVAYVLHMRTMRMKACFNLFRVRDRFVLLVAKDILPEDSRVFVHYYGRINKLLCDAPKVGIDDMLATIFRHVPNGEFDQALERARSQSQKMLADPLMQNDEVRAAVADYYRAIRAMLLSHSSILKVIYLLSHRFATSLHSGWIGGEVSRGLKAADYADEEAALFKPA